MEAIDPLALRMVATRLRMGTPQGLAPNECWPWIGTCNGRGYGLIQFTSGGKRHTVTAPRAALALTGAVPLLGRSHHAMHECDNPPCCNLAHIKPGNAKANMQDMHAKGRAGLSGRPQRYAGRHRKLTDDDVREIRKQQRPLIDIAEDYEITVNTVARIRMRQRKTHVSD